MKQASLLRHGLRALLAAALVMAASTLPSRGERPARPNFVIIFADDLGYGDLTSYGHPSIRTPHLDRMAREGIRFTDFYSAASVCTPSRAAILTGRLPVRTGMASDRRRVLFPDSARGLPANEITLAEALKDQDYATACIGKWHLGHLPQFLPTRQGFDSYFGIPYSNDMDRVSDAPRGRAAFEEPDIHYWNVPLLRDEEVVERPADQTSLTSRYTREAVRFIGAQRDRPFFLYFAHTFPHVPLFASERFSGESKRGLYGDVVEELDWSVGQVLDALEESGLAEKTLVFFTSDNGPWLTQDIQGGSAGLLREGKGSTWEGGMREPAIAWWPGTIRPSINSEIVTTLDLFPTFLALAGLTPPSDRFLDGMDVSAALLGTGPSPRKTHFFYRGEQLFAVRHGVYKAHFQTKPGYGGGSAQRHDPPLLFRLDHDPSEQFNVAARHPEILEEIDRLVKEHETNLVRGSVQLDERLERASRD